MDKEPITVEGLEKLKVELSHLKNKKRPQIVAAIAEARSHGDLKENAEYHAAKEQQSLMEARIKDIEVKLSESQIIDVTKIEASEKVIFGTTVAIKDMQDFQSIIYKIVGEDEANAKEGKISVLSPLAKNLIGKFEGDIVKFETPGGSKEYEIINVEYI
jgi:transcription elongation factor GreA